MATPYEQTLLDEITKKKPPLGVPGMNKPQAPTAPEQTAMATQTVPIAQEDAVGVAKQVAPTATPANANSVSPSAYEKLWVKPVSRALLSVVGQDKTNGGIAVPRDLNAATVGANPAENTNDSDKSFFNKKYNAGLEGKAPSLTVAERGNLDRVNAAAGGFVTPTPQATTVTTGDFVGPTIPTETQPKTDSSFIDNKNLQIVNTSAPESSVGSSSDSLQSQRDSVANMIEANHPTDAATTAWRAQQTSDIQQNNAQNMLEQIGKERNRITGKPGQFASNADKEIYAETMKGLDAKQNLLLQSIGQADETRGKTINQNIAANADATTAQATNRFAFDKWQYEQAQKPLDRASDKANKFNVERFKSFNKIKSDMITADPTADQSTIQRDAIFSSNGSFYGPKDNPQFGVLDDDGNPISGMSIPATPDMIKWYKDKRNQKPVQTS